MFRVCLQGEEEDDGRDSRRSLTKDGLKGDLFDRYALRAEHKDPADEGSFGAKERRAMKAKERV